MRFEFATATRIIGERWPHMRVIALTNFQDVELVQGALQAGATSYLLKNVLAEDLADAIRAAYTGQPTLAPEATQALIQATTQPSKLGQDLTRREWEVLGLLVEGQSNAEIAERLVIGLSTVKFHVSNILSKLDATSRAEAFNPGDSSATRVILGSCKGAPCHWPSIAAYSEVSITSTSSIRPACSISQ